MHVGVLACLGPREQLPHIGQGAPRGAPQAAADVEVGVGGVVPQHVEGCATTLPVIHRPALAHQQAAEAEAKAEAGVEDEATRHAS